MHLWFKIVFLPRILFEKVYPDIQENVKQKTKIRKKQPEMVKKSFFQKTTDFFEHYRKIFLGISIMSGALLCILLFDIKVSIGGDDSEYLINAEEFWRSFTYPGSFGALYPVVISPIVGLFGYKFILLKSISCIFMMAFLWFFYKSYLGKVSHTILYPTLLLISINSFVFFYAGQTYSEALFMLVQALFFHYFFKHFIDQKDKSVCLKTDWSKYMLLGCLILMMGLTRAIGYGAIGALIVFFVIGKRWKDLCYSVVAFLVVYIIFQSVKYIVWPDSGAAYDLNTILAKDHYNPIERESLLGFWNRFVENSKIYLSIFLCQFMGVIQERPVHQIDINTLRTVLLYLTYFGSMIMLFKKNDVLLFSGIYVGIMLFSSFMILHTIWRQDRFIMVYYPYMLIFFIGGIFYLLQIKVLQRFFFIFPVLLIILYIGTFSTTQKRIEKNIPVLTENLWGNPLYGLTPDWVNFINGSKWAAENLDKSAKIISRKPGISKVYTGRDFTWAPTDITVSFDSLAVLQNTDTHTVLIVDALLVNYVVKYVINFRESFTFNDINVTGVLVYLIPNTDLEEIIQSWQNMDINYFTDYQSFFTGCRHIDNRIYDPDMMINYLIENDIRYLLLPQLRVNPDRNSGVFINNTHRFVWFISYKYPDRFRLLHTVGKEEPCEIVEFLR